MGRKRIERFLSTSEETFLLGKNLAPLLKPNAVITLSGDLGAGKTTFVKGLAFGLGIQDDVISPTFVYLNIYRGSLTLFHFDLYRLKTPSDFNGLGFDEYFFKGGICAIEWPEKAFRNHLLQESADQFLSLKFTYNGEGRSVQLASEDENLLYSLENSWV